jgi:DNA replication protein DnaC
MLDRECPGIYLPSDFPDQIRKATGSSTVDTLVMSIARLRGLVVMDDLGVQNLNDFVRDQIARIIYHRYDSLLPIMITCNFDLAWIATHLDTRIADRIAESNQVFKLDGPNRRLKNG